MGASTFALRLVSQCPFGEGGGITWIEPDRVAEIRDRVIVFPLRRVGDAKVIVCDRRVALGFPPGFDDVRAGGNRCLGTARTLLP